MANECSICLDDIDVKVTGCTEMACGHKFHLGCIGKWLSGKDSCPLCRTLAKEKERLSSEKTKVVPVNYGIGGRHFIWNALNMEEAFNVMVDRTNNSDVQSEDERDITLIMSQTGIDDRRLIVDMLTKHNGDIVNAIMELISEQTEDGGTTS